MKKSILYISIGLVTLLALTNPSETAHKGKIKQEMYKIMEPTKPTDGWGAVGWNLGRLMVEKSVDSWAKRKNYFLFSIVEAENGKNLTFGIFGIVFSNIK